MARQFSPSHFFRSVPKPLLARFFREKHQVLLDVDFDSLKKYDYEPILKAYTALSDDKASQIEAELQNVEGMACQGGITALCDEAAFHSDKAFTTSIAELDGFHAQAMWSFLEHNRYWQGASLFLHADNVAEGHWKKRNNMPKVQPGVESEDIAMLASAISNFFRELEGRGRYCKVEVYRRFQREYFFAYPEDFALSSIEWVRGVMSPRARHPAFEIIFVYNQTEGSLDIYAPRNTKYVPQLQQIFAEAILGVEELDEFAAENVVYKLDGLSNPDFSFAIPEDSGIESVVVRKLRLSLLDGDKRKVTLEASTKRNQNAVYELLESLKLTNFYITQAEIQVNFYPVGNKRALSRKFSISYPNWCALKHEGNDLIIRKMLAASGIDLLPVTEATAAEVNDAA